MMKILEYTKVTCIWKHDEELNWDKSPLEHKSNYLGSRLWASY